MADSSYMRYSFLGGERSKSAQGRADLPDYPTGLNVCLNSYPLETGAWARRPGFRFLGTTRAGAAGRVLPFDFKQRFPYACEFTDGHLRFWSGPQLVMENATFAVSSISSANPAIVLCGSAHGYSTGDTVMFPTGAPTLLQNRQFLITVTGGLRFSLADAITGASIDGSTLGALGASPTVQKVYEVVTPYTAGSWANLRSVQAETTTVLLNGASPWALSVLAPPTSSTFATFSISQLGNQAVLQGLKDGPYLDQNGSTLVIEDVGLGQVLINSGTYPDKRQAVGFEASDVGRAIRVRLGPQNWNSSVNYAIGKIVRFQNGNDVTYWSAQVATSQQPGTNTDWLPVAPGLATQWAPGVITGVFSPARVRISISDTFGVYFALAAVIYEWQLGAYSDAVGWPTCGCYHEGRLWLGGAIDNRIDGSVSNDIFNFAPTDLTGTVADSNAIAAVFNAKDVNAIFWMRSNSLGIICGTQAGEWLVQATANNLPLTPTSIQAHRVTRIGCANLEPAETGNTMTFVQRFGRSLMEYFPDVFSGRLTAPNLAQFAKHLTVNNLAEITYQQELTPVVWMRDGAGLLKGITYKRENLNSSQGPTFAGWHRHALGSGRVIESICTGASQGGNLDALIMVTNDAATGIRHVEMLTDLFEEGSAVSSAWFLDDAVTPSSTSTTDTASAGFPYGGLTINGLWHLNGKTVQITASSSTLLLDLGQLAPNASTFTDYVVVNGSVTVPYGDGISQGPGCGLFDATFALTATIVVGFSYTSDAQLVKPMTSAESGSRSGPAFGKKRRTHQYALQTVSAAAMSFGTRFDKLNPILFKNNANIIMPPGQTFTDTYQDTLSDDYSYDSMLTWRITRPMPATVAAVGAFVHTQDR